MACTDPRATQLCWSTATRYAVDFWDKVAPNSFNPCTQATIMTDPGVADRTYVGPMTVEAVEEILIKVRVLQ